MFGIIAQVSLYDARNVKDYHIIRFAENEQSGAESNSARIAFHTTHVSVKESVYTAQVTLYNLNTKVWDWIESKRGQWGSNYKDQRLKLRLEVGWGDFGDSKKLWTIYDGYVTSYFVNREQNDNVFHFYCGVLPAHDDRNPIFLNHVPSSGIMAFQRPRREILKSLLIRYLYATGIAGDALQLNYTPTWESIEQEFSPIGRLEIKYDSPADPTEYASWYQWGQEVVTAQFGAEIDPIKALDNFMKAEGATYEVPELRYNLESPPTLQNKLPIWFKYRPVKTVEYKGKVKPENIIVNYEMLVEDPRPTKEGVEITSLMRPWLDVEDFIKLEIRVDENNPRPLSQYTTNAGYSNNELVMLAWGNNAVFQEIAKRDLDEQLKSRSFFNIPLQISGIQHIGDTHTNRWHTKINTFLPGLRKA